MSIEKRGYKTGFGTAVHQLILFQIAPIPDDIPSHLRTHLTVTYLNRLGTRYNVKTITN